jgi:hypothetical protein
MTVAAPVVMLIFRRRIEAPASAEPEPALAGAPRPT